MSEPRTDRLRLRRRPPDDAPALDGDREVVRHGFGTPGVERVVAWATAASAGSVDVLGKLGMRPFGVVGWQGSEDHGFELGRACG